MALSFKSTQKIRLQLLVVNPALFDLAAYRFEVVFEGLIRSDRHFVCFKRSSELNRRPDGCDEGGKRPEPLPDMFAHVCLEEPQAGDRRCGGRNDERQVHSHIQTLETAQSFTVISDIEPSSAKFVVYRPDWMILASHSSPVHVRSKIMIVKKHGRGILVLLPALLCLSTLTNAEMPEPRTPASGSVKRAPKASAPMPSSAANAQPPSAASGAASNPDSGDAPPITRSLVPNNPHPSVDPTQPWPRSGAIDESK